MFLADQASSAIHSWEEPGRRTGPLGAHSPDNPTAALTEPVWYEPPEESEAVALL